MTVVAAVAVSLLAGCGDDDGGGGDIGSGDLEPGDTSGGPIEIPSTTVPTTAATFGVTCVFEKMNQGISFYDAQSSCDFEQMVDDAMKGYDLRAAFMESLAVNAPMVSVQPEGLDLMIADACSLGSDVVGRAVNEFVGYGASRALLLAPMNDFTALVAHECPGADLDAFSGATWLAVTYQAPDPLAVLTLDDPTRQMSVTAQNVFEGANSGCDVIGGASALAAEWFYEGDLPSWTEMLVSEGVGLLCGAFK